MNATGSRDPATGRHAPKALKPGHLHELVTAICVDRGVSIRNGCQGGAPLMGWMAPASGIAMCHIGCRKIDNDRSHPGMR